MAETGTERPLRQRLTSVARRYWDLGFTSFGGPGVHVIILRQRFVDSLKWVDERTFLDLFALGNALPGPGSTQLAFSIAVVTNGVLPGLLAFLLWSLPGAFGMAAIGIGISRIPDQLPGPVLALFTGLNAAAVGLIALAAVQLGTAAGTDRITIALVWLSASFGICYHAPWMYPVLIAVGGLVTLCWDFRRIMWKAVSRKGRARGTSQHGNSEISRNGSTTSTAIELDTMPVTRQEPAAETRYEQEEGSSRSKHDTENPNPIPYPSPAASPTPTRRRLPAQSEDSIPAAPIQAPHTIESQAVSPASDKLNVVSIKVAIALIAGFVLLLTVPLATRAGLSHANKSVPRGLDVSCLSRSARDFTDVQFFCNLIIAGTIIFGGGPVVIPLLRDYVVVPGTESSDQHVRVC